MANKKIGLVFSGGGGKGPYEIGVWRYLIETGIDKYVGAVSGTSIGALNAAFFVAGDLDKIDKGWREMKQSDILTPKKISPANIISWFSVGAGILAAPLLLDPIGLLSTATVVTLANAATSLFKEQGSVFTQKGIMNQINECIDFDKLRSSDIPCYATCLNLGFPKSKPYAEVFDLRKFSPADATKILLASEAIPGVFEPVIFNGNRYCDGGMTKYGDNVPVKPVYDDGMEIIIVIHLNPDPPTNPDAYPKAKIIDIFPQEDLGGMLDGTMDFSADGASWRMDLGYKEAKEQLAKELSEIHYLIEG
jgi:NTE family protein